MQQEQAKREEVLEAEPRLVKFRAGSDIQLIHTIPSRWSLTYRDFKYCYGSNKVRSAKEERVQLAMEWFCYKRNRRMIVRRELEQIYEKRLAQYQEELNLIMEGVEEQQADDGDLDVSGGPNDFDVADRFVEETLETIMVANGDEEEEEDHHVEMVDEESEVIEPAPAAVPANRRRRARSRQPPVPLRRSARIAAQLFNEMGSIYVNGRRRSARLIDM